MNQLENGTERARRIAQDRPPYWQFLLAEELLRSRFSGIREGYNNLRSGKTSVEARTMRGAEYIGWLKLKLSDLLSLLKLLQVTFSEFRLSSGTPEDMRQPVEVEQAVDKLISLSHQFLDWEVDYKSVEPPPSFQRIRELMQGFAMECFEQIERIPDELVKPIQQAKIEGGTFEIVLKPNAPRNLEEIVKEVERLTNDVASFIREY